MENKNSSKQNGYVKPKSDRNRVNKSVKRALPYQGNSERPPKPKK